MKKLILCEGSHDKIFLMSLVSKLTPNKKVDVFEHNPSKKKQGLRADETTKIRNFLGSEHDILIKSERGKGKVFLLFPEILGDLIMQKEKLEYVKIALMVDLDVKFVSDKIINKECKNILNKIKHNFKDLNNSISIEAEKLPSMNDGIITYLIHLKWKETNTQIGNSSHLIIFVRSLEDEAKKIPSNDEIKNKICKLSERPEIQKVFEFLKNPN